MHVLTRWTRATLATIWNVLAVHGLFRIDDRLAVREMVITVMIAMAVSWAILRWYGVRSRHVRVGHDTES